jgi:hypothetical protein
MTLVNETKNKTKDNNVIIFFLYFYSKSIFDNTFEIWLDQYSTFCGESKIGKIKDFFLYLLVNKSSKWISFQHFIYSIDKKFNKNNDEKKL